jgi:hypothetical protein
MVGIALHLPSSSPHLTLLGLLKARFRELHAAPKILTPTAVQDDLELTGQTTALSFRRNKEKPNPALRKPHECFTPPTSDDSTSTSMVDGADAGDEVYTFTVFGAQAAKGLDAGNESSLAFARDNDPSSVAKRRRPLQSDSILSISTPFILLCFDGPLTTCHVANDSFRVRVNVISEANGVPVIVQAARTFALTRTRSPFEPPPPVTITQMDDIIHRM